jgi:lambda family phage portal protein
VKLDTLTGQPVEFDGDGTALTSMEPGSLQELLPGEEVQFAEPPGAGTDYGPFMRQQLMAAAASVGLPYEVLTGDLRDVSDRALRVILGEFRRQLEQLQWNVFIHQYCRPVWAAWTDAVALSGALPMPDYYRDRRLYQRVRWVPQGWPYINPVQDVQAQRIGIRAGLVSRSAAILAQGEDPESVDAEHAADNERADRLGLVFDSDPRMRDSAGNVTDNQEHTNDES